MKKKILWITETAVMLALLVTLQSITKPNKSQNNLIILLQFVAKYIILNKVLYFIII